MIYAEALGLENRPKTGIPDGRGLEYLIRMACDGTRGIVALAGMGFFEIREMKIGSVFLVFLSSFLVLTEGKRDKRKSSPRRGRFLCSSSGGEGESWQRWGSLNRGEDEN